MGRPESTDYLILGAGLAGCSLAHALVERDRSVRIIDTGEVGGGASGTPGALVNLATGRRGTRVWRAGECYRAIRSCLEEVAGHAGTNEPFFLNNGVLRPALTPKMAAKMREQYEQTDWDPTHCRWLDCGEIRERHPGITCEEGGLWLPAGLTVDAAAYLQAFARLLRSRGVAIHERTEYELSREGEWWMARTSNATWHARRTVFAAGHGMAGHPLWSFLDLHPVKGQLAVFESASPLAFPHSVSSLGYIARLGGPRRFVMGSTYEHDFEHTEPDEEGEQYLRNRLRRTLPELEAESRTVGQWSAVRVSTPNRKPVLGAHPEQKNLYCFTGLGSKGLLYSRYLAELLAGFLEEEGKLPKAVDIRRYR